MNLLAFNNNYNDIVDVNKTLWKTASNDVKDRDENLGLNLYDLVARNLDHALGRFMNVDPRAEEYNFQSPYAFANNNPVLFVDINGEGVDWLPKVNEDGSVSYIAEGGDSAETLQKQYNLKDGEAEAIIGNQEVVAGETVLSGEKVQSVTGNEVLKLDLSSDLATSQRRFDQFLFGRDYSTTEGRDKFYPTKYYSATSAQNIKGLANMTVDGESFKIRYTIPLNNGGTWTKANRKFRISNEPSIENVPGSGRTRYFNVTDKLNFLQYNDAGKPYGMNVGIFFNVHRSNSSKARRRFSKKFPVVNSIPLKQ